MRRGCVSNTVESSAFTVRSRTLEEGIRSTPIFQSISRERDSFPLTSVKFYYTTRSFKKKMLSFVGNTDINEGNLKLILGLIWSLIAHYQLGASNFPPKKLMLAWLRAVLPECDIRNMTSDWNSGIYLSALLDYCKPGLAPDWKRMNPRDG